MTDLDRSRRLRELFDAGRQVPRAARGAFCAERCGDDLRLREELEALLEASEGATSSVLDAPLLAQAIAVSAPGDDADVATLATTPAGVGPFRLLEQIGEGGMGTVYRAEQLEPVRREVAVKLIAPGMQSRRIVARFEAERQALARMRHPGIAGIHEAGQTDDGRPWFAMELIAGEPITAWCDARRLPVRARLALLRRVCDAVQHAHHKGVIHRDLKPTNVLVTEVDGEPRPKIIDFGIARAVAEPLSDEEMLTRADEVVGTPSYMSPEQLSGSADVDSRTDVYSLGVLLYELLAGELPFPDARSRRAAADRSPEPPSTRLGRAAAREDIAAARAADDRSLRRLLRGDLDWITLRALAPEPQRRYATAAELAADLQRHLDDEPVSAGPPGLGYRLRKAARRHRIALTAAGLVVASLVAGVVFAADYAVKARNQARAADRRLFELHDAMARGNAERALMGEPEPNRRQHIDLRRSILDAASPGYGAEHTRIVGTWIRSMESYHRGLRDLAAHVGALEHGGDPIVRSAMASLLVDLGARAVDAGLPADAERFLSRALELDRQRAAFDPMRVRARADWLDSLLLLGRAAEAEAGATAWFDEGQANFRPEGDLYMAIYRSLRGGARLQLAAVEDAERDLLPALSAIAAAAKGSDHHLATLGRVVALREAQRRPGLAQRRRDELADLSVTRNRGSLGLARIAAGPGHDRLWRALERIEEVVEDKGRDLAAATDALAQVVEGHDVLGTTAGRVFGGALVQVANTAGNVHGWREPATLRIAQLAEALLEPAGPDDASIAFDRALLNVAMATLRQEEFEPERLAQMARRLIARGTSKDVRSLSIYWVAQRLLGQSEARLGQEEVADRRMLVATAGLVQALGADDGNVITSLSMILAIWRDADRLDRGVDRLRVEGLLDHARNRKWVADWLLREGHSELAARVRAASPNGAEER